MTNTKQYENKYKMFRNFMCNELGISRHDIEAWTKEAVHTEVHKLVSGQKLQQLAEEAVRSAVRQVITGNSWSGPSAEMKKLIEKTLMHELVGKISIKVTDPALESVKGGEV